MTDQSSVLLDRDDSGIATITLNRSERLNAFTDAMLQELAQVVAEVNSDREVKVAIITGAGRAFCAGRDRDELAVVAARESRDLVPKPASHESSMFMELEMPTIAAVNGAAVGGGFGFVVQCDIRVASTTAMFMDGHLSNGMVPSSAVWHLPRLVGPANALRFFCSQARLGAAEALEMGLITQVVEPDQLLSAARSIALEFVRWDAALLRQTKQLVQMAPTQTYEESMQAVGLLRAARQARRGPDS